MFHVSTSNLSLVTYQPSHHLQCTRKICRPSGDILCSRSPRTL